MTSPSTFAFAIDLCLSHSTSALRHRPPPHAVDLQATPHTHVVALRPPSTIAASSASKAEFSSASEVESSSLSKVESSSASKDLHGKHNARRFLGSFLLEDDDYHREGKVTQVYRKKWVINRLLASITRRSLARLDYRRSLARSSPSRYSPIKSHNNPASELDRAVIPPPTRALKWPRLRTNSRSNQLLTQVLAAS
ncbi:hypothetical protein EV121DRAFT_297778 [Schizophyllum commune]